MPLNSVNYSNTIMYKIVCNDLNIIDCYVGHTTDFKSRKNQHKNTCNNINNNLKVYQYIRDNGGWNNWSMIMIEKYDCKSKLEALKRERELIEELKATLNMIIPTRTQKEYKQNNREDILVSHKEYYIDNKEKIKEMYKTKILCVCGCNIRQYDIKRHETTKKHNYLLSLKNVYKDNVNI